MRDRVLARTGRILLHDSGGALCRGCVLLRAECEESAR
jgi:hypothetical protein